MGKKKDALTLVELLALMVMLVLLVGLIVPGVARAREEAAKTQCRSNLRQLGLAIVMYCTDNGGYTPVAYGDCCSGGGKRQTLPDPAADHPSKYLYNMKWYNQAYLLPMYSTRSWDGDDSEYATSDPRYDDPFDRVAAYPNAPGGGVVTGLGLVYAGRYLTQGGAALLDCPSRRPPAGRKYVYKNAAGEGLWRCRKYADAYRKREARTLWRMDPDEPFWTTHGACAWADGDYVGEFAPQSYNGLSYPNGIEHHMEGFGRMEMAMPGSIRRVQKLVLDACNAPDGFDVSRHPRCAIIGSYMTRPHASRANSSVWQSWQLDDLRGKAVASDAVWGFWVWTGRLYNVWTPFMTTAEECTYDYWWSNHDSAYNVLFSDGSVKTYEDAGRSFFNEAVQRRLALAEPFRDVCTADMGDLYRLYFDPLYGQD